jgi:hypothetical protein
VAAILGLWAIYNGPPPLSPRPAYCGNIITISGHILPPDYRDHVRDALAADSLISVFDYILLLTQGDDFRIRVSATATPFITQKAIQAIFAEWDIIITDSHKNPVFEEDYTPEESIDFLKRGDRYDDELGIVRAPLVLASIFKPYYYYQPSSDQSEEIFTAGLIVTTEMELHMHGRSIYDLYHPYLQLIVERLDLGNYLSAPLRTYDQVTAEWSQKYEAPSEIAQEEDIPYYEVTPQVREFCTYCDKEHWYPPGLELVTSGLLLSEFEYYFNHTEYLAHKLHQVTRELECIFRRFPHLARQAAARYEQTFEFWEMHVNFDDTSHRPASESS